MCFFQTSGAIFWNQTILGTIFAQIFRYFVHSFRDFAQIFGDFAWNFVKSKFWGCTCTLRRRKQKFQLQVFPLGRVKKEKSAM